MRKLNSVSRMMAGASALALVVSASGALALPAPSTYTVTGQTPEQVYLNAQRLSNGVLSSLGTLATGSYLYNYVTVYFTPDTDVTGATFGVYEANFDPVSILYSGAYDPFNPNANAIAGNDDNGSLVTSAGLTGTCGGLCSGFSANLIGGQTYYLFLSTYSYGTAFTTPVSFFATGTTFNWGTFTPTPTSTDIDTAAPGGYDAAQLGSGLNAVFAGGTLYFTTPGALSQNFQLGNSATNTIDLRGVSVNLDGNLSDQTTNGSIIFTNTGGTQTSILLNGNSTYTGSTTIENNVFLSLYGSINNTSHVQIKNGGLVIVRSGGEITAGHITNDFGGQLVIEQGATVTDDLDNAGSVQNSGTYNAIVNSNTGAIQNMSTGTWNGEVRSNTSYLINAGTWNGDIASSGDFTNSGTLNGDLTVSGWGTANNSSLINGTVTLNDGILNNTGTVNGDLNINASLMGLSRFSGSGVITGRVNNSGVIEVTADMTTGAISNSGSIDISEGVSLTTDGLSNTAYFENAGTVNGTLISNSYQAFNYGVWTGDILSNTGDVGNNGIWNGDITTSGFFRSVGTINGDLTNSGDAILYGTINGTVNNSGSANVWQDLSTGAFTNTGSVEVYDGAALETGQIINSGTLAIYGGGALTADGVTNQLGGQLTIAQGATLTDDMDNAGTVGNAGTSNAIVNTNSGTITNFDSGIWNGEVLSNTGTLINAGVWNGDVTTSGAFASVGTLNGDLTNTGDAMVGGVLNGTVTNSGTLALDGNLSGNGAAFDNTGTLIIANNGFNGFGAVSNAAGGNIAVGTTANAGFLNAASLSNAGALHMANGRTGDVTTIAGTYTGTAGSVLSFDVDMLTGQADRLNVGTLTGTSTVRLYNSAGGKSYLSAPIVLVAAGGGDGTLTTDTDAGTEATLGRYGLTSYSFRKIDGTSNWGIVSSLNTQPVVSLSEGLTAYVTAQNLNLADLPEEVFVRDGAYGVNQWMANSWARAYSGDLSLKDAFSVSDDYSSGGTTKAKTSQDGVQYGFDAGVYNIHGTGVSLLAGFMGGSTDAKVTDKTLSDANVKIDAPNYGYYAALTHKGLRLSVQNRNEILKADVTNPALGLSNSRLKARSETFSVALSNRFDVSRLFVEPVIGYMTTKVDADTLDIPADMGSVKIASLKSKLIRAGVRVGTSMTTEQVVFTPYGELNAWQEDAAKTQTAYVPEDGGAIWLAGQRTGAFGQALLGVTAQSRANENLSGHLTADARLGDTLNGWTVRAGVKYRLK